MKKVGPSNSRVFLWLGAAWYEPESVTYSSIVSDQS
jgi:hypothetical protein